MAFFIEVVGFSIAVPFIVAVVCSYCATRCADWIFPCQLLGVLASSGAFMAATLLLPWMPNRPDESWQFLPICAMVAGGVSLVPAISRSPAIVNAVTRLITVGLVTWVVTPTGEAWSDLAPYLPLCYSGLAISMLGLWYLLDPVREGKDDRFSPWIWVANLAAVVVLIQLASLAMFAQLGVALFSAFCGIALMQSIRPTPHLMQGALPCFSVVYPGLLLSAYYHTFSQVPLASFLIAIVSPLSVRVWQSKPLRGQTSKTRRFFRAVIAAAPIVIALGIAALAESHGTSSDDW